ncbi:MAG: hypothetical protein E6269_02905 [Clostridiales bacterium]|nr:hypothetical protein [Clostridiales bacterium]
MLSVNEELANDNKVKYNVGIQDKTRAKYRNWPLLEQLSWVNDESGYMQGTTIKASEGNVKENKKYLVKK